PASASRTSNLTGSFPLTFKGNQKNSLSFKSILDNSSARIADNSGGRSISGSKTERRSFLEAVAADASKKRSISGVEGKKSVDKPDSSNRINASDEKESISKEETDIAIETLAQILGLNGNQLEKLLLSSDISPRDLMDISSLEEAVNK